MRIGIVGVGRIGRIHAENALREPGIAGIDLVDLTGPTHTTIAADGRVRWHPSFIPSLTASWDAAIVAVPTDVHAAVVSELINAKVPTLCEKPLTRSADTTLELGRAAQSYGVSLRVGLQRRFDPQIRLMRQLVAEGRLGRILSVNSVTRDPAPPSAEYLRQSGGIFLDMHVHDFDLLRWLLDDPITEVAAVGVAGDRQSLGEVDDFGVTSVAGRTRGGIAVGVSGSRWSGPGYDIRLEVTGTTATATLTGRGRVTLHRRGETAVLEAGSATYPGGFVDRFAAAYRAMVATFLREVARSTEGKSHPSACARWQDDFAALCVADAAERSARSGQRQTCPLAETL